MWKDSDAVRCLGREFGQGGGSLIDWSPGVASSAIDHVPLSPIAR